MKTKVYPIKIGLFQGFLKICDNVPDAIRADVPDKDTLEELEEYVTLYGGYVDVVKTIYIERHSKEEMQEALLHEMIECCDKILGLELPHVMIQSMAFLLITLISENKPIRDMLLE